MRVLVCMGAKRVVNTNLLNMCRHLLLFVIYISRRKFITPKAYKIWDSVIVYINCMDLVRNSLFRLKDYKYMYVVAEL